MKIDWAAFGEVFVVSFGTAVGVMVLFAFGTTLLAGPARAEAGGPRDGAAAVGIVATAVAGLCFLACGLVVLYGLYIIVS
jgi:hypothetical protein